ncbi:MAG: rhodanese-like domain-containing protein, partial [Sinomicrobium sp.]|nr:rhodanese-like domain-containing protein [Sinomicrobium sp.]
LYDADFASRFANFNKKEPVYVYCRSGRRSARAQQVLKGLGYTRVVNLEGGFLAWEAAGKAVEK